MAICASILGNRLLPCDSSDTAWIPTDSLRRHNGRWARCGCRTSGTIPAFTPERRLVRCKNRHYARESNRVRRQQMRTDRHALEAASATSSGARAGTTLRPEQVHCGGILATGTSPRPTKWRAGSVWSARSAGSAMEVGGSHRHLQPDAVRPGNRWKTARADAVATESSMSFAVASWSWRRLGPVGDIVAGRPRQTAKALAVLSASSYRPSDMVGTPPALERVVSALRVGRPRCRG